MNPLLSIFRKHAAERPQKIALVAASGHVTTRRDLLGAAEKLAALLSERSVGEGDAVAVQLPNSVDFIAAFLALREVGATMVPIDRDATESEVAAVLTHFACRASFWVADRHDPDSSLQLSVREPDARPAFAGAALLKLTSGSTGLPKGVVTTEGNLFADGTNICRSMEIGENDVNLGVIPFSHSYGFSNLVVPLLLKGTPIAFSNDYLPLSLLELANRHSCTVFPGIPMIFDHLSQLPENDGGFDHLRTAISAGAPLSAQVSVRFRKRFGISIHSFYGCSETGGISYDRSGAAAERGTVGEPLAGVEIEIDPVTARLHVYSAAVAGGYAIGSEEQIVPFASVGYLTEDLASESEKGEIALTGRAGELINTAGKKVNPREVESVILQIPGVHEVQVYGEAAGARGEIVVAAVVGDAEVTREAIRARCREVLSAHKVPRVIKMLDALPRDERGKVKRSALHLL